jgi:trigger factor
MQFDEIKREGLSCAVRVIVPSSEVNEMIDAHLAELAKEVKIAGFRDGKVPLKIVRSRYQEAAENEVLQSLVRDGVEDAHKRYHIVAEVDLRSEQYKHGEDFQYEYHFELMPDITAIDVSSLAVSQYNVVIGDDDVSEMLTRFAAVNKEFKLKAEGELAALGDAVSIDFEGSIDGVPFAGGKGENHRLELGSGQFIPGFEDQLVGLKSGDQKVVVVAFPNDYHAEDLAGKEAHFSVLVHEVLSSVPSELNDQLAERLGFENLEQLREIIRGQIKDHHDEMVFYYAKKSLLDALDAHLTYDLPPTMVAAELKSIKEKVEDNKNQESNTASEEMTSEKQEEMARRRVKIGLFFSDFAEKNQVKVTQNEIRDAIYEQARSFPGQEHKIVDFFRKNQRALESITGPLLEKKVTQLLLEMVALEKVDISVKGFVEATKEGAL